MALLWLFFALMLLCLVPMAFASVVWLFVALWRFLDALLQGTIGAVRLLYRVTRLAARGAWVVACHLHAWHAAGTAWAGRWLRSFWSTYSYVFTRRFIASQLRLRRKARMK